MSFYREKPIEDRPQPSPSSIKRDDPRYPIWGLVFMCRVPRIARYSTQYLEAYGMHTSGSKGIDRGLMTQLDMVYIPIAKMVTYYHQSQTVSIVKQADVKEIYEICQKYTFDWADKIRNTLYTSNAPFADLIKIDEFAEAVYRHAAYEYGEQFARTFIPENVMKNAIELHAMFDAIDKRTANKGKKVDTATVVNRYSPAILKKDIRREEIKQEEAKKLPERPTVRDIFMSYMDNQGH